MPIAWQARIGAEWGAPCDESGALGSGAPTPPIALRELELLLPHELVIVVLVFLVEDVDRHARGRADPRTSAGACRQAGP